MIKPPKIDLFLLCLIVFGEICLFQRGSKSLKKLKNWRNPRFWPPSEMNIFRQKRPNATKIHKFWEVLSTFISPNKKYQNKTPFWSFLIFSLLSYIEIYIEYRETARREGCIPYMGSQPKNFDGFVFFGPNGHSMQTF